MNGATHRWVKLGRRCRSPSPVALGALVVPETKPNPRRRASSPVRTCPRRARVVRAGTPFVGPSSRRAVSLTGGLRPRRKDLADRAGVYVDGVGASRFLDVRTRCRDCRCPPRSGGDGRAVVQPDIVRRSRLTGRVAWRHSRRDHRGHVVQSLRRRSHASDAVGRSL
jgi:hypothetical protein